MTGSTRHLPRWTAPGLAAVVLVTGLLACVPEPATPTPTPSPPTTTEPSSLPPASLPPETVAPASPTATPVAEACPVEPDTGKLPSDRLVNLRVSSTETVDRLTFVFGNTSLPGPAGPPKGTLRAAKAPYTEGGSGAPIDVVGDHVVQLVFEHMSLSNDAGQETYAGPPEVRPNLDALRHAVLSEAFEGVVGWYVGYDGPGCLTLTTNGNEVTLAIDHA